MKVVFGIIAWLGTMIISDIIGKIFDIPVQKVCVISFLVTIICIIYIMDWENEKKQ